MKRLIKTIALAVAVAATSLGARPAAHRPVAQATAPAVIPARPALWRVADADTTIFLFGTVHALPKGVAWFNGTVANAFDGSQELVTEIVETDPAAMQSAVQARALLPAGQSLRALLPEKQRAAFEALLAQNKLPPEMFDRFKPWYAAVFLSSLPILRDGYAPENGAEQVLDARAKAARRPHTALETAEYQLGLFDSLPQDVQLRYLGEVIDTLPEASDELRAMIDAWKRGDAEKLAQLMNEDESAPELMELLVSQRNRIWAQWIDDRLDRPGVVFVAVGAGHLAGNGSVQSLLAAKGIASTRVQ